MRELYRSYMREFGFSLMIGALFVAATVAGLHFFTEPKGVQVAENTVTITAPVTEDTPGPIVSDSGVPDREIAKTSPLADRDR